MAVDFLTVVDFFATVVAVDFDADVAVFEDVPFLGAVVVVFVPPVFVPPAFVVAALVDVTAFAVVVAVDVLPVVDFLAVVVEVVFVVVVFAVVDFAVVVFAVVDFAAVVAVADLELEELLGVAWATVAQNAKPDPLTPRQQIASWATIFRVLIMSLLLVVDPLPIARFAVAGQRFVTVTQCCDRLQTFRNEVAMRIAHSSSRTLW